MARPGFNFCICPDGKLLRQHVKEILATCAESGPWEQHVFWGDEELPARFWEFLTLQGLFSVSRVLLVRNAHALPIELWKRLTAALSRPNQQAWPIFCFEGPWERGQPKIPAAITKLSCFQFADTKNWIWRQPGLDGRTLRAYIQTGARSRGLRLATGSLEALCEILLPEAAAVDTELDKLSLLATAAPLTADQVRLVAGSTTSFNVFTFLKQIQNGQHTQAWKSLLDEQRKGEEPLFYLLAMLQREARQLWQILAGEQVRMAPSEQASKKHLARQLGIQGLAHFWSCLHTAELAVKSGRRSPGQALDALIGDLTTLFSSTASSRTIYSR